MWLRYKSVQIRAAKVYTLSKELEVLEKNLKWFILLVPQ